MIHNSAANPSNIKQTHRVKRDFKDYTLTFDDEISIESRSYNHEKK